MATRFAFVPVDISSQDRSGDAAPAKRDLVSPDYRTMIRSLAARNPWNRPVEGETLVPGLQKRRHPQRPSMRVSKRTAHPLPANSIVPGTYMPSSSAPSTPDESVITRWHPRRPDLKRVKSEPGIESQDIGMHSFPNHDPSRRFDPFGVFPIPYRDYMSKILEHRLTVLARYTPILDDAQDEHDPSAWAMGKIFMEHRDSRSYFYATLLYAAGHFEAGGSPKNVWAHFDLHPSTSNAIGSRENIIWLRGATMNSINEDLRDPNIMTNPSKFFALLAAISNLATFECYFGDVQLHKTHWQSHVHLVKLHGGLKSLDPLSQKFYHFVLRAAILASSMPSPANGLREILPIARELRDLLWEPARELGYDIDEILKLTL